MFFYMSKMSKRPKFIPGLELSEAFYTEAVRLILHRHWPWLRYSAGLIGPGSEVLGFDTPMSMDHHWGPRAMIFLSRRDHVRLAKKIRAVLAEELPVKFRGLWTHIPWGADSRHMTPIEHGPIDHFVEIFALEDFVHRNLRIDVNARLTPAQWLTFGEQHLLEMTRGKVYHDGLGSLNRLRRTLQYYPKDVWLFMLAGQWTRIGQEEHLTGRAGYAGDELGSRVIMARHVRDCMRLCFLMARTYAPYPKWFGTAFKRLACAAVFEPLFKKVLQGGSWKARQRAMTPVYEKLVEMHNSLGINKPLSVKASKFHGRPFVVIHGDRMASELRRNIRSKAIRNLKPLIGGVDQFSDSTDFLESPGVKEKIRILFE